MVVIVDGFKQLLGETSAEVFGGDAKRGVHQAEARFKMQREKTAHRIGFGKVLRRPIVTECSVAATGDAADVAQSKRIDISGCRKRPWAAFRPSCHAKGVVAQGVGDR